MVQVNLPINLTIPAGVLERALLKAMAAHIGKALRSGYDVAVHARVSQELENKIRLTPQYGALTGGGRPWGEMGIKDPIAAVTGIIAGLNASMRVVVTPPTVSGMSISGGAVVEVSRSDFEDVISEPMSSFISNGHSVDWLEWMLLPGPSIILPDWSFKPGNTLASRTRQGTMIKTGTGWQVPVVFRGTFGNNWITQLLAAISPIIELIMIQELERRL